MASHGGVHLRFYIANLHLGGDNGWAENDHVVVPFVSDTLGSLSGESAVTLCPFAWCQAVLEARFFVDDWGDGAGPGNSDSALVEASKHAFRRWDARLTLAVWRATATRATGPGVRVVKNWGSRRNGTAPFPEMGAFVSVSQQRVVRERTLDPSCTQNPAGGS